ncbi:MAG: hypothetical protein J6Y10_06055 [Lachnospiraceae bacterium]|nr:hypothetical protein [Lachnospiraceae bacterium]
MKNRLSATKYIKNNKRTCFVLILALALTFMAMYVIAYIMSATVESVKPITLELPKHIALANVTYGSLGVNRADYPDQESYENAGSQARDEFCKRLESDPDVEKVYFIQTLMAGYVGVVGGVGFNFPLVPPEQVPEVLAHVGAKLTEGRLPADDGEVLIDERILRNGGMKVGDWFQKDSYGEVFKIVGAIRSDEMACVGTPRGYYNSGWFITVLCNENSCDFTKLAAKYGVTPSEADGDVIDDIVTNRDLYEHDVADSVEATVAVIMLVTMIFLSISMIVAYVSFMRNRVNEYCLYVSIGYSRSEIYGMIMREMMLMFTAGILLGAAFSVGCIKVLEGIVIEPKGLVAKVFMKDQLLRILGAFVMIIGVLQIPVIVSVYKIKTIDLIED